MAVSSSEVETNKLKRFSRFESSFMTVLNDHLMQTCSEDLEPPSCDRANNYSLPPLRQIVAL